MICPVCDCPDMAVRDSRPGGDDRSVRRRRHCTSCGARVTTVEVVVNETRHGEALTGQKPTRSTELFDLIAGLQTEDAKVLVGLARRLTKLASPLATRMVEKSQLRAVRGS